MGIMNVSEAIDGISHNSFDLIFIRHITLAGIGLCPGLCLNLPTGRFTLMASPPAEHDGCAGFCKTGGNTLTYARSTSGNDGDPIAEIEITFSHQHSSLQPIRFAIKIAMVRKIYP